mgnify:CR=1 FL=1
MIESIITSKVKRRILELLLSNPDKEYYIREIEARTSEPYSAVRRELLTFENAGLVKFHRSGLCKYYSIEKESPVYAALKQLFDVLFSLNDLHKNIRTTKKGKNLFFSGQ